MLLEPQVSRLANGLTVVVFPRLGQTVTCYVYVRDGSRSDVKPGELHKLEHDVFKGTKKLPHWRDVNEFLSAYPDASADTSYEHVRFYLEGMPDQLESMIFFLSELTLRPRLLERAMNNEIRKEKLVISEELFWYEDDPGLKTDEYVWQMMYRGHPLSMPIVGTPETLEAIKRKDLVARFHRTFRPENMLVVIHGNVGERTPVKYVKLHFTARKRKNGCEPLVWTPPSFRFQPFAKRVKLERRPLHKFYLSIGFPTRGLKEPNRWALKLASRVLGELWGSLIMTEMREKFGIGYHPFSSVDELSDAGMFVVSGDFIPGHYVKAIRKFQSFFRRLCEKPVDKEALEAAKTSMAAEFYMMSESGDWAADYYYDAWKLGEKLELPESVIRKIKAVDADEVRKAAKRILHPSRQHVAVIGPLTDALEAQTLRLLKQWEREMRK